MVGIHTETHIRVGFNRVIQFQFILEIFDLLWRHRGQHGVTGDFRGIRFGRQGRDFAIDFHRRWKFGGDENVRSVFFSRIQHDFLQIHVGLLQLLWPRI